MAQTEPPLYRPVRVLQYPSKMVTDAKSSLYITALALGLQLEPHIAQRDVLGAASDAQISSRQGSGSQEECGIYQVRWANRQGW